MTGLFVAIALAQTPPSAAPPRQPVTKVVFDTGDVLSATLDGPGDEVVESTARPEFASLIRLRESFKQELLRSATEVK